ncbi:MAG: hypothetical protein J3K34DRAFT_504083 [Monoraphidium minutum]|nr:MAG: hypothetical protein J3K34DRAFT_504083 [Monoraphidium minutum]
MSLVIQTSYCNPEVPCAAGFNIPGVNVYTATTSANTVADPHVRGFNGAEYAFCDPEHGTGATCNGRVIAMLSEVDHLLNTRITRLAGPDSWPWAGTWMSAFGLRWSDKLSVELEMATDVKYAVNQNGECELGTTRAEVPTDWAGVIAAAKVNGQNVAAKIGSGDTMAFGSGTEAASVHFPKGRHPGDPTDGPVMVINTPAMQARVTFYLETEDITHLDFSVALKHAKNAMHGMLGCGGDDMLYSVASGDLLGAGFKYSLFGKAPAADAPRRLFLVPAAAAAGNGGLLLQSIQLVAAGRLVEAGTPAEAVERLLRQAKVVVAYANARRVTAGGGGGAARSLLLFTLTGGSGQRRELFMARDAYMAPRGQQEAGEGRIWLLGQQMSPHQSRRRAALQASPAFAARIAAELRKPRRNILWVWDACAISGEWWTVEYAQAVDAANAVVGAAPAAGGGAPPPAAAGAAGGPGAPDAATGGGGGGGGGSQSQRQRSVRRVRQPPTDDMEVDGAEAAATKAATAQAAAAAAAAAEAAAAEAAAAAAAKGTPEGAPGADGGQGAGDGAASAGGSGGGGKTYAQLARAAAASGAGAGGSGGAAGGGTGPRIAPAPKPPYQG